MTLVVPKRMQIRRRASARGMARPQRPSDPARATGETRTFFVTSQTAGGRSLFQTTRMAELFIEVLRSSVKAGRFTVHDFVVMPNHVHILMTVPGSLTIEKAVQFVKGGFSFRAKKELGFRGEIWQQGFSDVRNVDDESFHQHCAYIDNNPVKSRLAGAPEEYPFGMAYLKMRRNAVAEARAIRAGIRHD